MDRQSNRLGKILMPPGKCQGGGGGGIKTLLNSSSINGIIYCKKLPMQNEIHFFIFHSILHKRQPILTKATNNL